jgi:acyl carrier protein
VLAEPRIRSGRIRRNAGPSAPIIGDRQKGHIPVTNEEILHGLAEIVNEVAGVETSEITPEKSFVDELDIDSLSMVEIAVQVEDRFGVKVPDDVLANLKTVGDAVDYVAKTI